LTPLLDTLFLLLFSLLAASQARRDAPETEVLLRLPEVEAEDVSEQPGALSIALIVDAESIVRIEGSEAELRDGAALDAALRERLAGVQPSEVSVEIRADRDARYGVGVELLQHLRLRGYADVLLRAIGSDDPHRAFRGSDS
jgi:biopolymer transport protein ExbD